MLDSPQIVTMIFLVPQRLKRIRIVVIHSTMVQLPTTTASTTRPRVAQIPMSIRTMAKVDLADTFAHHQHLEVRRTSHTTAIIPGHTTVHNPNNLFYFFTTLSLNAKNLRSH